MNEYRRLHAEILREYGVPALQADWESNCLKAGASPGVYLDWDLAWQELGLNTDGGQDVIRIPAESRTWRQANMVTYYFLRAYGLIVGNDKRKELGFPEATRRLEELNERYPKLSQARIVSESPAPQPTFLRVRGSWDRPGIAVSAATPRFLPALATPRPTRLDLAKWLFASDNPLTARVAVNRVWQEYFGRGLVATSDDFGKQGDEPSHPGLLDWLAAEFRDSGWDIKNLHRLIVTSETYKQASAVPAEAVAADPGNGLLSRQARLRLPAELVWDRALEAAGLLHHDVGGPGFRPAMPAGAAGFGAGLTNWKPSAGRERYKRGMYIHFQRNQPFPFLMNFDSPDFRASACRRDRSNTPLQALNLLNDPAFAEAWLAFSARVLAGSSDAGFASRLRRAFALALGRSPTQGEVERFARYVPARREQAANLPDGTSPLPVVEGLAATDLVAWAGVGRILMNLDEFVIRP